LLLNAHPVFTESQEVAQFIVTFADITDRERAEKAEKDSEGFLESIIENNPLQRRFDASPQAGAQRLNAAYLRFSSLIMSQDEQLNPS
jgi:PAS domain-containing protein